MGIVVSTGTPTSPFFLMSGIIGFVSFGFTLGTFLKVVWTNLETMTEAPHEVHAYLTNLRQELLEEKYSIRVMRKGMKSHARACKREGRVDMLGIELDEVMLKTMGDNIKRLCRNFAELERPFLEDGEPGINDAVNHRKNSRRRKRDSSSDAPRYSHGAYASPPEKDRRSEHGGDGHLWKEADEDTFWAQRTTYASYNLRRRMQWLRKKPQAQQLFETLSRVQTRRIARQVGGMAICMHEYGAGTMELKDTIQRIDDRVNRVVGVRRVE